MLISDSDLLVIKVDNGQPVGNPLTYSNFRMLYPATSFPELPNTDAVAPYGYAAFVYVRQPAPVQFENTTAGPLVWDDVKAAYSNTWVNTPFTPEQMQAAQQAQLNVLRMMRDQYLLGCDWTQLPDVPLTPAQVDAWRVYRQQLRDYINTVTDPFNPPAWPIPPAN